MTTRVPGSALLQISSRIEDHSTLRMILHRSPWAIHSVFSANDALGFLCDDDRIVPVVICEECLPDGDWRFVLRELDRLPVKPALIVSARLADENLWAEALNLGAFDVLLRAPFEAEEVIRVTESAWHSWNHARGQLTVPRLNTGLDWRHEFAAFAAQALVGCW